MFSRHNRIIGVFYLCADMLLALLSSGWRGSITAPSHHSPAVILGFQLSLGRSSFGGDLDTGGLAGPGFTATSGKRICAGFSRTL